MKNWMMVLAMAGLLGMSGMADACHKGKHGVKGKVAGVGQGNFTMTVHGRAKHAGQMLNVSFGTGTTINGAAGIDSTLVGKEVEVEGAANGNTLMASEITVAQGQGHHRKA